MPELFTEVPSRALAIYAHPDDADVASGGTLAKWAADGTDVHVLICTDGGKGTTDPDLSPTELVAVRRAELDASAALIGIAELDSLGAPDGELDERRELREELVAAIRRIRPEVVLGHDPTAVFFGQDYVNHRDHRTAGWCLLDALAPGSALPHYFPSAGAPFQVPSALLSGTLEPDCWVDVTSTIEKKVAAVECHRSQFEGPDGGWVGEAVRRRAAAEGKRAAVSFAEGFRLLRFGH